MFDHKISKQHRVWINFLIVIREKIEVLNAAGVWGSCNTPRCSKSRAGPSMGNQENPIFTAQKAIDWVIYSFFM